MNQDNAIQILSLLSILITVISGLLSITKDVQTNGLVNSIKTLMQYLLPILFIKQLILLTYFWYNAFLIICETLFIFFSAIESFKSGSIKSYFTNLSSDKKMISLTIGCSPILHWLSTVFFSSDSKLEMQFINQLQQYKISTSMYEFFANNLQYTFSYTIELISVAVLLKLTMEFISWSISENETYRDNFYYLTSKQIFLSTILSVITASGLHKELISIFLSLF